MGGLTHTQGVGSPIESRTAKLWIWTLQKLVFFRPRIPFCAADALWGSVTHTFGQISKHVGVFLEG